MNDGKTRGNLRDFRIDTAPTSAPAAKSAAGSVPRQSVRGTLTPIVAVPRPRASAAMSAASSTASSAASSASPTTSAASAAPFASRAETRLPPKPTAPAAGSMKEWSTDASYARVNGADSDNENLWTEWENELAPQSGDARAERISAPPISQLRERDASELSAPAPATLQSEHRGQQPWSVELAVEERRAEKLGVVDVSNSYRKQELLKLRTVEFMRVLQQNFRENIELFNEARRAPGAAINIYKVSQSAEDFMLFRNGVKLVVSGQRAGLVSFAFNQFVGQLFAPQHQALSEIEAAWGPFDQLHWSYRGERVLVLELTRYFLTEFSRQSFR